MKDKKIENAKDVLAMLTVAVLVLAGFGAILALMYIAIGIWGLFLFLFMFLLAWSFGRIAKF